MKKEYQRDKYVGLNIKTDVDSLTFESCWIWWDEARNSKGTKRKAIPRLTEYNDMQEKKSWGKEKKFFPESS